MNSGPPPPSPLRETRNGPLQEFFQTQARDLCQRPPRQFDPGDRRVDVLLARVVRQDDRYRSVLALRPASLLDHGVDRNIVIGQMRADVGEHAWFVLDAQAHVVAGDHSDNGRIGRSTIASGLNARCGTMLRVGGMHTRHVDEVGNHRRNRRFGTSALAVVQRRTDRVALDEHRVHRAFDVGDQALRESASDARAVRRLQACAW